MTGPLKIPLSICRSGEFKIAFAVIRWVRIGFASQTLLTGVGLRLGRRLGTPYMWTFLALWSMILNSFIFSCLFPLLIPQILFLLSSLQIECEEREKNQPKVDEVKRLEDLLSNEIDKKSNYYLKRVTKPFHKRWDDASMALNRYRNEDYPFAKPSDCLLVERLKKALIVN